MYRKKKLSEKEINCLNQASQRPIIGRLLDFIISLEVEKSLEPEEQLVKSLEDNSEVTTET